jgi:hypothetical protein
MDSDHKPCRRCGGTGHEPSHRKVAKLTPSTPIEDVFGARILNSLRSKPIGSWKFHDPGSYSHWSRPPIGSKPFPEIRTLGDIAKEFTYKDLYRLRRCGWKAVEEIGATMDEAGLSVLVEEHEGASVRFERGVFVLRSASDPGLREEYERSRAAVKRMHEISSDQKPAKKRRKPAPKQ